jgi:hypothetical protein
LQKSQFALELLLGSTQKCKTPLVRAGLQIVGQKKGTHYGPIDAGLTPDFTQDETDKTEDRIDL